MALGIGIGISPVLDETHGVGGPPPAASFLLLTDAISFFLLTDGTSKLKLAGT